MMQQTFQQLSLLQAVTDHFLKAITLAYPALDLPSLSIAPANPSFGDYQCNSALIIFKKYRDSLQNEKTVEAVAQNISEMLEKTCFSNVTVAKQGFITVRFCPKYLEEVLLQEFIKQVPTPTKSNLTCLIDFSSPNIAKEMHVGHLRSTILGESLARVLEFCGYKVLRINHLGDWGTQFGMLIEYLKETIPDFQEHPPSLTDLTNFYKQSKNKFDVDPDFRRRAQLNVPLLQGGDPVVTSAWKSLCDISRKNFQMIYDRLSIELIERGESFYNNMIPDTVKEITEKGYITDCSGAKCFFIPNDPVPLFVVKADGGYGYDSTDLAAVKYRLINEKVDIVLYVADIGQENHFKKIFKAAEIMGWFDPSKQTCLHIGFGLVQGEDGKKFKTRSGDTVKLLDLMDEAVNRCLKELRQRYHSPSEVCNDDRQLSFLDEKTLHTTAETIAYSAIRYFDLKQNRISNYRFSYEKMLDPKGNTAVYLLYAYARICAIFRKKSIDMDNLMKNKISLIEPQERDLAILILRFYEVIVTVSKDFLINRLTDYVYNLSTAFTTFYQTCKIISSEYEKSRLLLCEITRRYLEKSFYLLGIKPLEYI